MLRNKRSHHSEKPTHHERVAPVHLNQTEARVATKTQHSRKQTNKTILKKKKETCTSEITTESSGCHLISAFTVLVTAVL